MPGVNVTPSVYFGANATPYIWGPGYVTVQFAGAYTSIPSPDNPANNYLYLKDVYVAAEAHTLTSKSINGGVPSNYTFTELTTPRHIRRPARNAELSQLSPRAL